MSDRTVIALLTWSGRLFRLAPWLGFAAILAWMQIETGRFAETRAALRAARADLAATTRARTIETELNRRIAVVDTDAATIVAGADSAAAAARHVLQREIVHDPRPDIPAAALSDGLRRAIDAARTSVACTAPADGDIVCTLSAPEAAGREQYP